jgi:hypothetical protein
LSSAYEQPASCNRLRPPESAHPTHSGGLPNPWGRLGDRWAHESCGAVKLTQGQSRVPTRADLWKRSLRPQSQRVQRPRRCCVGWLPGAVRGPGPQGRP